MFIDFQELKKQYTIEHVCMMLDLELSEAGDQLRGACPACKSDRALVVTPSRNVWYCHEASKGGDQISLVAHIHGCGMKDAALFIAEGNTSTEKSEQGFSALTYLQYEHEAVQQLGLDPATAETLGIGYANKGMMRGKVAIPIHVDGKLVGYIGVTEAKLPPRWQLE